MILYEGVTASRVHVWGQSSHTAVHKYLRGTWWTWIMEASMFVTPQEVDIGGSLKLPVLCERKKMKQHSNDTKRERDQLQKGTEAICI